MYTDVVPDPKDAHNDEKKKSMNKALEYMDLVPGTKMTDIKNTKSFYRFLYKWTY